ncbi:hypothetical protein WDV06_35235, partial [Streptomyces racemochromogenes]
ARARPAAHAGGGAEAADRADGADLTGGVDGADGNRSGEVDVDGDVDGDVDVDMETLRLLTAGVQRAGGSHWTGHSLWGPPRPVAYGGPRWAQWRAAIHSIG